KGAGLCRTSEHSSAQEESVQFILSTASSLLSRSLQGHIIYIGNMSLVLSLIIMQLSSKYIISIALSAQILLPLSRDPKKVIFFVLIFCQDPISG
ncbi:TPA: hypothetical protein ACNE1P_004641, partial [Escherichia coli]